MTKSNIEILEAEVAAGIEAAKTLKALKLQEQLNNERGIYLEYLESFQSELLTFPENILFATINQENAQLISASSLDNESVEISVWGFVPTENNPRNIELLFKFDMSSNNTATFRASIPR